MTVREILGSELDELLRLYKHLHISDDPPPERARVEALWHQIKQNPDLKYFGVFLNGRLVSSCTLSVIPNLTRGCRPYGVIENVVTHPNYRRKGLGKTVLKKALDYSWNCNCYKVMLLTGRTDEVTFQFYESAGFDRYAKQAFLAKPKE